MLNKEKMIEQINEIMSKNNDLYWSLQSLFGAHHNKRIELMEDNKQNQNAKQIDLEQDLSVHYFRCAKAMGELNPVLEEIKKRIIKIKDPEYLS